MFIIMTDTNVETAWGTLIDLGKPDSRLSLTFIRATKSGGVETRHNFTAEEKRWRQAQWTFAWLKGRGLWAELLKGTQYSCVDIAIMNDSIRFLVVSIEGEWKMKRMSSGSRLF